MTDATLLGPLFALVALTGLVWLAMLRARARRMHEKGIVPQDMPSRGLVTEKLGDAEAANNALMNLFKMPVLKSRRCRSKTESLAQLSQIDCNHFAQPQQKTINLIASLRNFQGQRNLRVENRSLPGINSLYFQKLSL